MAFVLTAAGAWGVSTALIAVAFALLVFATGGARLQPRALAAVIFLEGATASGQEGSFISRTSPQLRARGSLNIRDEDAIWMERDMVPPAG